MSYSALVLIIAGIAAIVALLLGALSRHQKSARRQPDVIGSSGIIERALNPEGSIIVNGELWRARLQDGTSAQSKLKVRVVGADGHLLLVEPLASNKSATSKSSRSPG